MQTLEDQGYLRRDPRNASQYLVDKPASLVAMPYLQITEDVRRETIGHEFFHAATEMSPALLSDLDTLWRSLPADERTQITNNLSPVYNVQYAQARLTDPRYSL